MPNLTTLDREQSRHVVDKAIRTQAQVILESPAFGRDSINGFFVSGDGKALLIEMTGLPSFNLATVLNAACDVQFYSGKRYRFSTVITATPAWGESRSIAIARPDLLTLGERRRFLRATLAPSSTVQIEWRSAGGAQRHTAAMLNVSGDGLACRLQSDAAHGIRKGDSVRVSFKLPWQSQTFRFDAVVTNNTPASAGNSILGIQFSDAREFAEQRADLKECLENPQEAMTAESTL